MKFLNFDTWNGLTSGTKLVRFLLILNHVSTKLHIKEQGPKRNTQHQKNNFRAQRIKKIKWIWVVNYRPWGLFIHKQNCDAVRYQKQIKFIFFWVCSAFKLNEVARWNTGHDEMTFQLLPRWNMNVVVPLHFASQRGCFAYWKWRFGCYHDETWMSHAAACCDKATEWQPCISFPSKGLRAVASFSISSNLAAATCQHCFCPKDLAIGRRLAMVPPNRFSYRSKIFEIRGVLRGSRRFFGFVLERGLSKVPEVHLVACKIFPSVRNSNTMREIDDTFPCYLLSRVVWLNTCLDLTVCFWLKSKNAASKH